MRPNFHETIDLERLSKVMRKWGLELEEGQAVAQSVMPLDFTQEDARWAVQTILDLDKQVQDLIFYYVKEGV